MLSELDLEGAKVERVIQPTFDSLSLGLYKGGRTTELFFSIAHGACRLHALSSSPPKPTRPLRFMECLRSRIRGGSDKKTELEFRAKYRAFVDAFRAGAARLKKRAAALADMFPLWSFPPALPFNAPA